MVEGRRGSADRPCPGRHSSQHQFTLVGRFSCKESLNVAQRIRGSLHNARRHAAYPVSDHLAASNSQAEPARNAQTDCTTRPGGGLRIWRSIQPGVQTGIRAVTRAVARRAASGLMPPSRRCGRLTCCLNTDISAVPEDGDVGVKAEAPRTRTEYVFEGKAGHRP